MGETGSALAGIHVGACATRFNQEIVLGGLGETSRVFASAAAPPDFISTVFWLDWLTSLGAPGLVLAPPNLTGNFVWLDRPTSLGHPVWCFRRPAQPETIPG